MELVEGGHHDKGWRLLIAVRIKMGTALDTFLCTGKMEGRMNENIRYTSQNWHVNVHSLFMV